MDLMPPIRRFLVDEDDGIRSLTTGQLSVQQLDVVKRSLDDVIEWNTDTVTGRISSGTHHALTMKRDLVSEVDRVTTD